MSEGQDITCWDLEAELDATLVANRVMLTRLKVSGFKNLVDVDVSFGPFTCIAGANGVGKSNLLDAIIFLSALAEKPLSDAALSVRDLGAKTGDIRGLFHHVGDRYADQMTFEAEMIIPAEGEDDLGQSAEASATFVRYGVSLRYRQDESSRALGSLELVKEELKHITLRESEEHLKFSSSRAWRKKFIKNARRIPNYISTDDSGPDRHILVHQDGGGSGTPQKRRAANLPRTVLSAANSAEFRTATLVKREMQSWRQLQLEPSALRTPDNFSAPAELESDGAHLPAMLFHLANSPNSGVAMSVYAEVANRLSELIEDVRAIYVDRDESRQLLTLYAKSSDGTAYPARSLSDGTLRFLALSVLSIAPDTGGVICMEEPENGIHPKRIPAMIKLLRDLATDPQALNPEGRLRQVIINTHSPAVVMQVPDDSLLIASPVAKLAQESSFKALQLHCLPGTWRIAAGAQSIPKGELLAYLNPVPNPPPANLNPDREPRRVADRQDLIAYQTKLPFADI